MQCKHDKELPTDFCILIFFSRCCAALWSAYWCRGFASVSAYMYRYQEMCVFLYLCVSEGDRAVCVICLNTSLDLVSTVWMVDVLRSLALALLLLTLQCPETAWSLQSIQSHCDGAAKGSRRKQLLKVQEQANSRLSPSWFLLSDYPALIFMKQTTTFTIRWPLPKQHGNSAVMMRYDINPYSSWNLQ